MSTSNIYDGLKFHSDLTLEKFWLEWFGQFGRELGSNIPHSFGTNPKGKTLYHRQFSTNPQEYLEFIEWCRQKNVACWITSQPMCEYGVPLGIEKIFFDFDYHLEQNENMTPSKREKVRKQVLDFIESVDNPDGLLIVETRKGYHVYVFLERVYEFEFHNIEIAKEIFGVMGLTLLGMPKLYVQLEEEDRAKWKYLDFGPLADIMRMARVPLTLHEKSGVICKILDKNLKPTKIRDLNFYKTYGILEDKVREAAKIVKAYHHGQLVDQWKRVLSGTESLNEENGKFQGQIRKCFTERLRLGEMKHLQRRALLVEAYWAGFRTEEQLMDICSHFKDFLETKSRTQVRWFLKNDIDPQTRICKVKPWRCKTIRNYGWCLKIGCDLYHE